MRPPSRSFQHAHAASAVPPARCAPPRLLAPDLEWQGPCRLEKQLRTQTILNYDQTLYNFADICEHIFASNDLGNLHREPIRPWNETAPALRRAQVQARVGGTVTKGERKGSRRNAWDFAKSEGWKEFIRTYERFIVEWVAPQLGNEPLLYQRKPILRVVLPGSVAPTQCHCDADYYHDANELNFWVPLSKVSGSNSLYSESEPGKGDYKAFEAGPGEAVRFWGNRCRHYTVPNDSERTRVSFDFRVIQERHFRPPAEKIVKLSKHSLCPGNSKRGYYAVAYPSTRPEAKNEASRTRDGMHWSSQRSLTLGAQRRAWREAHLSSTNPAE